MPKLILRRATLNSFDPEKGTFSAIISTGAARKMRDARGSFDELIDLASVDLAALVGRPLIDAHNQSSVKHVLGRATAAKLTAQGIVCDFQLSTAEDMKPVLERLADGTLNSLSIGYGGGKAVEGKANGHRTVTRTGISIEEISLVPAPADRGATLRSNTMDPTELEVRTAAVEAIAARAAMTREWIDSQVESDLDVEAIRTLALDEMKKRVPKIRSTGGRNDDPRASLNARIEALTCRMTGATPSDAAREFMGLRVVDHAAALLELQGESTRGMTADAIFTRAGMMTTSDFPLLMGTATNRVLLDAYQAAATPLKMIGRQALHTDFKGRTLIRMGEMSQLERVPESGEIRSMTRGENGTTYYLKTYAGIISYSRQLMINDNLGGLADQSQAQGQAAAQTEASLLSTLFLESSALGPVMWDGKRLFHVDHGNLGTAAALSVASLSLARLAMRSQKGADGVTVISVVPKWLIVGPELETLAEQLLATLNAVVVGEQNPFAGKLSLVVDPYILDGSWYVAAANPVALEYAYLSSAPGPQLATREGFDILGMEFRVVLDFGAGFIDWKSLYRNPGI
jgi:hypothetical protein